MNLLFVLAVLAIAVLGYMQHHCGQAESVEFGDAPDLMPENTSSGRCHRRAVPRDRAPRAPRSGI